MIKDRKPMIGIAWYERKDEEYAQVRKAIEAAGGIPIKLKQVCSCKLDYDENGMLTGHIGADGALNLEDAGEVRRSTWEASNVEQVSEGIDAVVFPGGGDMSPSLFLVPEPVQTDEGFCVERDVSDYILMSYCLEKDIPVLGICRGMQTLAIVSGASMIQDIRGHMKNLGKEYDDHHRKEPEGPEGHRDYTFHDVTVTGEDSILRRLTGTDTICAVPSWHHQAVKSIEDTPLIASGVMETCGEELIEAIERTDKTFALGLQYHPETAVVRELDDISLAYFIGLVDASTSNY